MIRACFAAALVMLALAGCARVPERPAPVIVLSPMGKAATAEQQPACQDEPLGEHVRAERWKAYAEKLERQLGIKKRLGIEP